MNSFYPNSYYKSPNEYKRCMIKGWKHKGVIYDDYDDLYEVYVKTMNCSHCLKEFKNSRDRQLDHDHQTGKFRAIICSGCNVRDSYLKYPPHFTSKDKQQECDSKNYYKNQENRLEQKKEYYQANKDQILEKNRKYYQANRDKINQKVKCFFCAKEMISKSLKQHYLKGRCVIKPIT
jgi:hypothetical protein